MIKLMVVDDSQIFLEGLSTIFTYDDSDIQVVCSVSDPSTAMDHFKTHIPDVVLLDIKMPGINGVELARAMIMEKSDTKIIMLTTFDDHDLIVDAIQAGAQGYFLKDTPVDRIVDAVLNVYKGNVILSSQVLAKLADYGKTPDTEHETNTNNPQLPRWHELSQREKEILLKIGEGKSNQEIAEDLFLSEKTVRNYVSHIYEIMDFNHRSTAIVWVRENLPG